MRESSSTWPFFRDFLLTVTKMYEFLVTKKSFQGFHSELSGSAVCILFLCDLKKIVTSEIAMKPHRTQL